MFFQICPFKVSLDEWHGTKFRVLPVRLWRSKGHHWDVWASMLPSGKPTKNYGKSPFLMGKSTKTMENHHAINGKTHYFYGHFQ